MDGKAYLSLHGDLKDDYFYLLDCNHDFDSSLWHPDIKKRIIQRGAKAPKRAAGGGDWLAVQTEPHLNLEAEVLRECPNSPKHVTQCWWRTLSVIPFGSGICGSIMQGLSDDGPLLIRSDVREKLRSSKLTGWDTGAASFVTQDGQVLGKSDDANGELVMWYLKFRGKARLRPLTIDGAANECAECGHTPIICQNCLTTFYSCPQCGEELLRAESQPRSKHSVVYENPWKRSRYAILEGKHWEGDDFVCVSRASMANPRPWRDEFRIVTRRVIDWLIELEIAPFAAIPISVDVSGMNEEQLELLRQSQRPINGVTASEGWGRLWAKLGIRRK
jgi:hypothetical protein